MKLIELPDLRKHIPSEHFNICLVDNLTKSEISTLYTKKEVKPNRKSCYYIEKLIHHLKIKHNLTIIEYCEKYLEIDWPVCPAKNTKVGYKVHGNGLILSRFSRGVVSKELCPKFKESCKKLSEERKGEGNPMFGKPAWNKGLGLEDERVKAMADKRRGQEWNEESKTKQRQNRKEHPLKARHTTPHSTETVNKLREITTKRYSDGLFKRESSIHIKMREFLQSLNLSFTEEYQVKYFSIDFAFVEQKIALEVDGDFFHSNPLFYPNGPETKIQERNFGRDKIKDEFLNENGWKVIRIWECEINSEVYKEKLIKQLRELNLC